MRLRREREIAETKKIKENQSFDTCEHKLDLLESSLKWRNIQNALRWLERVLASNHSSMERCGKKKTHERRSNPGTKTKNHFHQSRTKKFKEFFKRKKPKGEEKMAKDAQSSVRPKVEKKFKRKHIHKHRAWKNRPKNGRKELKGPPHDRKYFVSRTPLLKNATTIAKPNSALPDAEKILPKRAKNRNAKKHGCPKRDPDVGPPGAKENCLGEKNPKEAPQRDASGPKQGGAEPESKLPKQKAKAWPHFVYHRVSSDFFHPEPAGHNHRQSAYVAISVATSSKPERSDNNTG